MDRPRNIAPAKSSRVASLWNQLTVGPVPVGHGVANCRGNAGQYVCGIGQRNSRYRPPTPRLRRQSSWTVRGTEGPVSRCLQHCLRGLLAGYRLRVSRHSGSRQRNLRPPIRPQSRRRDLVPGHLRNPSTKGNPADGCIGDRRTRPCRPSASSEPAHESPAGRAITPPHGADLDVVSRRGDRSRPGRSRHRLRHASTSGPNP